MKVVYSCYWGSYLAVVAASLHLGGLSSNMYTTYDNLSLPLFNSISNEQMGELFFMGKDDKRREIYIIGAKNAGQVMKKTFNGISEVFGLGRDTIQYIDLNGISNFYIFIGGLLIKKCGMAKLGMRFILIGIKKSIQQLNGITHNVKSKLDKVMV